MTANVDGRGELSPVQRALLEQRRLRARLQEAEDRQHAPVAVIGLGCRFPGAPDPAAFWRLLRDGEDAIAPLPADRWDVETLYDPDPDAPGKISTRWGGFLEGVDRFDAAFFGISRREADGMDPQQRLLLEVAWEALEHAGLAGRVAGTSTGVFVGVAASDYAQLASRYARLEDLDAYTATGYSHSVVSGRLSYTFGLEGPSVSVDTACSSSLVAAHLACRALRAGECRTALAGGVNHILAPDNFVSLSKARMMAPDGQCKTFDAAADGFVRSEGCGIVVLKRLSDALSDGDRVLAVLRGSATNQDGRSGGLTVPSGLAQASVIRSALEDARVKPSEVSYVEAHGTGTSLGDPIEVQALGEVLGEGRDAGDRVRLGSVKTNVGHLESAAGVCSLVKVVLALRHDHIPPSLHFEEPNPEIPWEDFPFLEVASEGVEWEGPDRTAGISSFGFSGTNAHLVVGAPPAEGAREEAADAPPERPAHVLTLSGRSAEALDDLAARYLSVMDDVSDPAPGWLADACYTAGAGRRHFEHRLAVPAASVDEARDRLRRYAAGEIAAPVATGARKRGDVPRIAFLFTGQGAQSPGMGRQLYETQPVFRAAMDRCAGILDDLLDRPLLELLYGEEETTRLLGETAYTQPAMFAFQHALFELWTSWGVVPSAVMGHSLGEFSAARAAGVFSLEDGLRVVTERGRLMSALPPGGRMAAVFADPDEVTAVLRDHPEVEIAAVNGPANVVISGPASPVEDITSRFLSEGTEFRRLEISNGFHSRLVEPILEDFEAVMAGVELHEPRIPMVSNLTGEAVGSGEVTTPGYWRDHLRHPVSFQRGTASLAAEGTEIYVEIGPHGTLLGLGQQCVPPGDAVWLPSLRRDRPDWEQLLETVAGLYAEGVDVDWRGFDDPYGRRLVDLPTYAFQRSSHWFVERRGAGGDRDGDARDAWERTVDVAGRRSGFVPMEMDLRSYVERWELLDRLTTAHVVDALRSLGMFETDGESLTPDELCRDAGVRPVYRDLMELWLERLVDEGSLGRDGDRFRCPTALEAPDLADLWTQVDDRLGDLPELRDYLRRCGRHLPEVITGRADPLDTLFPDGSFETAEFFYRTWALPRYFNGIVAGAVASWVANSGGAGRNAKILEIGAGSGGTTSAVLAELPRGVSEYWFTDVSEQFLSRAEREFADTDFLRGARFDAEEAPAAQGFEEEAFDVVVAANSLHATRDLRQAIDHASRLLRPGGLLVLYEVTRELSWFPMSIALIEGWQRHADELRSRSTVLSAPEWGRALGAAGFEAVEVLPEAGSPAEVLGHHVILARRPGAEATDRRTRSRTAAGPFGPPGSSAGDAPVPDSDAREASPARPDLLVRLREAPPSDREGVVVDFVRRHVMDVLRLQDDESPDRKDRLMDLGFDSLMAVELRGRLVRALDHGVELPSTLIFDYPTIEAIAGLVRRRLEGPGAGDGSGGPSASAPEVDGGRASEATSEEEIAGLPDDQVERLLIDKLEDL